MWSARRLQRFTSVEAGALTTWSPQIFETNTFDGRGDVVDRAQVLVRREQKLQAINPWRMSWIRAQRLSWPAEHFSLSRSLW
jgi:hypothetical protein